jgi:hypothetical protein
MRVGSAYLACGVAALLMSGCACVGMEGVGGGLNAAETNALQVKKSVGVNGSPTLADEATLKAKRERLRQVLGAAEIRMGNVTLETAPAARAVETERFTVQSARWPVFRGVWGEGLWLKPKGEIVARVVVLPDADQTPELISGLAPGLDGERQFARRFAENHCEVLVPTLIDRGFDSPSATPGLTNLCRRDRLCRQAMGLGRHVAGYELQKVMAAMDYFERNGVVAAPGNKQYAGKPAPIAVAGYGEGGLLALCCAAVDTRVTAALVSGYLDSPRRGWEGPLARDVYGLLPEFRDSVLAAMVAPRKLVVEHSPAPESAKGLKLGPDDYETVEAEFNEAMFLLGLENLSPRSPLTLVSGSEGLMTGPFSDRVLIKMLNVLGVPGEEIQEPGKLPPDYRLAVDAKARQREQFRQLEAYTMALFDGMDGDDSPAGEGAAK